MKNKQLYIIMVIAIIIGIIVIAVKDFNYGTLYSDHQRLEIVLGANYDIDEVTNMVNETISEDPVVRKTTLFETSIAIDAKSITDEEITNLLIKLNEKYEKEFDIKDVKKDSILTELNATDVTSMTDDEITALIEQINENYGLEYTAEELQSTSSSLRLTNITKISFYDLVKGAILPGLISLVIIAIYFSIRFHKLCEKAWIKVPLKFIFEMILNQAFIISIIAIIRIPITQYILPFLVCIWILQLISATLNLENETQIVKQKENEQKRHD